MGERKDLIVGTMLSVARRTALVAGSLSLLAVSACGSDSSDEIFADPTAEPSAGGGGSRVGDGTSSADSSGTSLSNAELAEVFELYEQFLDATDLARFGDEDAVTELSELASSDVLAQIDAWRAENEANAERDLNLVEWESSSNVLSVADEGGGVVLHDCIEARKSFDPEVQGELGPHDFVDQLVTVVPDGDGWLVEQLEIRNDGTVASERLSCVPDYHRERIEASMADILAFSSRMLSQPDEVDIEELGDYFEDPFLSDNTESLPALIENDWAIVGDEEVVDVEVLGSHTEGWQQLEVALCTEYPDGRGLQSSSTGEPIEDAPFGAPAEPGTRVHALVTVRFREADDPNVPVAFRDIADGELVDRLVDTGDTDQDSDCGAGG